MKRVLAQTSRAGASKKTWHPTLRMVLCSLLGGLLLGVPFGVGKCYVFNGDMGGTLSVSWKLPAWIVLFTCAFAALFLAYFVLTMRCGGLFQTWKEQHPAFERVIQPKRVSACLFVLILLIWVPAFLALYPGYYASDGCIQVNNFFVGGFFDQHQPVFHTIILTGLFSVGNELFGSYNAGLTLYCVVQAICVAASLAFACRKAIEWKAPRTLCVVATLLVVANPVVQAWTFTTTKDILFGASLLFSFVFMVEWIQSANAAQQVQVKTIVALGMSLFFMCMLRKQGVYIVVVACAICLIAYRRLWKQVLLSLLLPGVLAWACMTALALGLHAVPDSAREMLSLPSQQIARVYVMQQDDLTQEDIAEIEVYYDLEGLKGYLPLVADPAKGSLKDDALGDGLTGYIVLWIKLGLRFPGAYLNAFLNDNIGYFYPSSGISNYWAGLTQYNQFELPNSTDPDNQITQESILPVYYNFLQEANFSFFPDNALLMLLESPAVPYIVLVFALILLLAEKRYQWLFPWLLPALFWCSLLLGPVLNTRYSYPLVLCTPALLALALCVKHKCANAQEMALF